MNGLSITLCLSKLCKHTISKLPVWVASLFSFCLAAPSNRTNAMVDHLHASDDPASCSPSFPFTPFGASEKKQENRHLS